MARNAIARRRPSRGSSRKLMKAETSLRNLRKKVRDSKVPGAVGGAAAVLAGAAAAGAIQGYGYPQIMGVDTDVAIGVASVAAGIAMKKPTAILFGAGALTKAVGEWADAKAQELRAAA